MLVKQSLKQCAVCDCVIRPVTVENKRLINYEIRACYELWKEPAVLEKVKVFAGSISDAIVKWEIESQS